MNRPPRDFLNWLKEQELIGSYHQIEKTTKKSDIYTVMNHIQTKGEGIDLSNIYKSRSSDEDLYKLLDFGEMDEFAQANRLRLRPLPKQIIKKLKVGHLDFTEQYTGKLIIENCWIGDLSFRKGASMEIEIIDTWIGRIKLEPRLFRHATINGGGILSFDCPTPEDESPFVGNFLIFPNCFLPKKDCYYKDEAHGTQPWANVRAHLLRLGNLPAATRFQSCEMSIERQQIRGFRAEKVVSWLYDTLCDYGNSIGRPVAWLFAIWVVFSAIYFWGDGTALTEPQQPYVNWRRVFTYGDFGKAAQAIWLSSQWLLNPLGFLKASSPVEPSNAFFAFIHAFHRLFSTVLVFLIFLAIRRKFRMSGA